MKVNSNMGQRAKLTWISAIIRCIMATLVVECYNVDNVTVKRITRPKGSMLGYNKMLLSREDAFHFGYDFAFDVHASDNETRLIVGSSDVPVSKLHKSAVKENPGQNQQNSGQLFSCSIETANFFNNKSCDTLSDPTRSHRLFGGNTVVEEDVITTCSPMQEMNCEVVIYKPGFCYQTTDRGQTWKLTKNSETKNCPIFNVEVMFVLDGSGSIGYANFEMVKDWVIKITEKFDIDGGSVRVGVVQFSHWYKTRDPDDQPLMKKEILLGQYSTSTSFSRAVRGIKLQSFTTYTAHALNVTAEHFQESDRFEDINTKKVVILLTDGASHDFDKLPATADYVRSLGIVTYAVGVGKAIIDELRIIATGNTSSSDYVYWADNFNGLDRIVSELQTEILKNVLEGTNEKASVTYEMEMAEDGFSSSGRTSVKYFKLFIHFPFK
ncbi:integrin alpha-X-like [Styela clava]